MTKAEEVHKALIERRVNIPVERVRVWKDGALRIVSLWLRKVEENPRTPMPVFLRKYS